MAKVQNGVETLLKISIDCMSIGCTNVTDRQTEGRRQTERDGIATANTRPTLN